MAGEHNRATDTARAFATYSLVPYLGILFCPGAMVMGSVGLLRSYRTPDNRARTAASFCIVVGLIVLVLQLLLWWLLYKVPEWARGF
jgi:hypothetical protein